MRNSAGIITSSTGNGVYTITMREGYDELEYYKTIRNIIDKENARCADIRPYITKTGDGKIMYLVNLTITKNNKEIVVNNSEKGK